MSGQTNPECHVGHRQILRQISHKMQICRIILPLQDILRNNRRLQDNPFHQNSSKSVPNLAHGRVGISCGIIGSRWLERKYVRQTGHLATFSSISRDIFGQYITPLALALHFSVPAWPWCTRVNISGRIDDGMISLSFMNSNPFSSWISLRNCQYGWSSDGTDDLWLGHPW